MRKVRLCTLKQPPEAPRALRTRPHKRVTLIRGFLTTDATIKSKHFRREELTQIENTHMFWQRPLMAKELLHGAKERKTANTCPRVRFGVGPHWVGPWALVFGFCGSNQNSQNKRTTNHCPIFVRNFLSSRRQTPKVGSFCVFAVLELCSSSQELPSLPCTEIRNFVFLSCVAISC